MTKYAWFTFFWSNFQSKLNKDKEGYYVNVHYTQQWHNGIRTAPLKNGYVKQNVNLGK